MATPHKQAALIKAWADGAEIQYSIGAGGWKDCSPPSWSETLVYRVKPAPKPDFMRYTYIDSSVDRSNTMWGPKYRENENVRATFDGETGKLKSIEMI